MNLKNLTLVKEFRNTKEDWISLAFYLLLGPFAVVIGLSLLFGTVVGISLYVLFDYLYKMVVYFINEFKDLIYGK